jgi:hypothetical protein
MVVSLNSRLESNEEEEETPIGPTPARKVDVRLPGKGNSTSHGARPVYQNHLDGQVDSDQ